MGQFRGFEQITPNRDTRPTGANRACLHGSPSSCQMSRPQDDRNQEATVYLVRFVPSFAALSSQCISVQGNLDERCTDALIWELMLQAGPVGEISPLLTPPCMC